MKDIKDTTRIFIANANALAKAWHKKY